VLACADEERRFFVTGVWVVACHKARAIAVHRLPWLAQASHGVNRLPARRDLARRTALGTKSQGDDGDQSI